LGKAEANIKGFTTETQRTQRDTEKSKSKYIINRDEVEERDKSKEDSPAIMEIMELKNKHRINRD